MLNYYQLLKCFIMTCTINCFCTADIMAQTMPKEGKFELIKLPYAEDALEPVISQETVALHHGKHLQTYVTNLNNALPGTPLEGKSLEEVVMKAQGGVLNNAGQTLNHNMYFMQLCAPCDDNKPSGKIAEAIDRDFGSFEAFKKEFTQKGTTLFGSGWVWLSADKDGKLVITQEPNAGNPIRSGLRPLMCFDVWEHAYYVDYRNRRAEHIDNIWKVIDWKVVEKRIKK